MRNPAGLGERMRLIKVVQADYGVNDQGQSFGSVICAVLELGFGARLVTIKAGISGARARF